MRNIIEKVLMTLYGVWFLVASVVTISSFRSGISTDVWSSSVEFLKLILGPAIGAGFAFYVNDYVHKERKKTEERTAISGVSFAMGAMYDDFLNYKLAIREMLATSEEHYKGSEPRPPIFLYARPVIAAFNESNIPNLLTISFILHISEGRDAFQKLQHLVRAYKNLIDTHKGFIKEAEEMQLKLSVASENPNEGRPIEQIIGRKTCASLKDFLMGVVERVQMDEQSYIDAMNSLAAAADKHLNELTPLKHKGFQNLRFLEENMPPMPKVVIDELDAMKTDVSLS